MGKSMCAYKLFDHMADVGVEIRANDETSLFNEGLKALFFLFTNKKTEDIEYEDDDIIRNRFKLKYRNIDEALIDFFNHLIFLVDANHIIPVDLFVKIKKKKIFFNVYCLKNRENLLKMDIKAATLHNFKVEKDNRGLKTRIVFDV